MNTKNRPDNARTGFPAVPPRFGVTRRSYSALTGEPAADYVQILDITSRPHGRHSRRLVLPRLSDNDHGSLQVPAPTPPDQRSYPKYTACGQHIDKIRTLKLYGLHRVIWNGTAYVASGFG